MDEPRWVSWFEEAPPNEYQRRPLPPIPLPEYSEEPPPTHHKVPRSEAKKKRHNGRHKKKNNPELTETSVVLTLSIRNENQAKRLKNAANGFPDISVSNRPTSVSVSSNEESSNSKNELVLSRSKRRRRRRRRNVCILPMVVLTAVILAGLITAVTVIFIAPHEENVPNETPKTGFSMLLGHVQMRILNKVYNTDMEDNNNRAFTTFSMPLCQEIDNLFLYSNISEIYYGCTVKTLRSGSIVSYKDLVFKDKGSTGQSEIIKSVIQKASPVFQYNGNVAVKFGDYIVDHNSIEVTTETYTVYELPHKPQLHKSESTTKPTTTTAIEISTDTQTSTIKHDQKTQGIEKVSTTTTAVPDDGEETTLQYQRTTKDRRGTSTSSTTVSTPATSTKSNEPEKDGPYLKMADREALLHDKNVAVTCKVGNLEEWQYIVFSFKSDAHSDIVILNVSHIGTADFPNPSFARRLIVDIKLASRSAVVSLNFTEVGCQDEGVYTCTAYSPTKEMTGKGTLRVKEHPTTPVITMPVELVQDREISEPIICTANIGYPPGTLLWKIRPNGYHKFLPFNDAKITTSGDCNHMASSSIIYTPSLEGNGTVLKCEVINNQVTTSNELFTTAIVKVVKGDICTGKERNITMPHPYSCDKYVRCFNNTFKIYQCPNELCYNAQTGSCGQTGLTMGNVVAFMNERLTSLTCRLLHMGKWNSISIWKVLESNERIKLLTVYNDSQSDLEDTTMRQRIFAEIQAVKNEVDVKLWIYNLECDDNGIYECKADVPFELPVAQGQINLRVKPKTPEIYVPSEIIDGRSLRERFACVGDVGYPHGTLKWEMKYQNETEFQPIPFNETVNEQEGNCSLEITKEFMFTPTAAENGMVIRCVVENIHSMPEGQILYTSLPIHVIPANYCTPDSSDPIAHPFECSHYIQCNQGYLYVQRCSQGLCFNPESRQCDLPEPVESDVVDPNHPCKPNRNGVYFPHPFLCNKYIWCVQGKEIIQHCPLGTLYLSEGQCTFDTYNSHCFHSKNQSTPKP